jgi:hypothetical protein
VTEPTVAPSAGRRRRLQWVTAPWVAVSFAGVGACALFLARLLSLPSASSYDAWAYTAWGQAFARGEQLLYNVSTTPKPLATVLAAIVSPLPPARAWGVVVALSLGILVAALLAAGHRDGGVIGAAVAGVVLVAFAPLDSFLLLSLVDAVTAALVLLGIALRGRARIVPFVLAGLLRPEAWLASGVAAYMELGGSRLRRAVGAAAFTALPVVLWLAFDLAFARDALATREFTNGLGAAELGGPEPHGLFGSLRLLAHNFVEVGALFALIGAVGLIVHSWRTRRESPVSFPLAIALVWTGSFVAEAIYGLEVNVRYFLPLVAILALGWGLLAGALVGSRWASRPELAWAAVAVVLVVVALDAAQMELDPKQGSYRAQVAMSRSLPALEEVLECGRLGLVGRRGVGGTIGQVAASARTSLGRFERAYSGQPARFAGILAVRDRKVRLLPPSWPRRQTPLGPLAVNPSCPSAAA